MPLTVAIVLIIISIALHELGHALAMQRRGVEFKKIAIGFGPSLKFKLPYFKTPVSLGLLPLGGAVSLTEAGMKKIESLNWRQQFIISGAGIWANMVFGIFLLSTAMILANSKDLNLARLAILIGVPIVAIGFLVLLRRWFCWFGVPLLGLGTLVLIIYSLAKTPADTLTGPVGTFNIIKEYSPSYSAAFGIAFAICISIALFNAVPLLPLDGGKYILALIKSRLVRNIYLVFSLLCFVSLMLGAIVSDILNIGH